MALSFKVASSSQTKQGGIIQRLTRSPPDYNWATFGLFLLHLCQWVIVDDVLIIVADNDEALATPDDAGSFSAFRINMWWKLKLLDEVDKLDPPIFFNHQYLSDCGRVLRVSGLLALYLD